MKSKNGVRLPSYDREPGRGSTPDVGPRLCVAAEVRRSCKSRRDWSGRRGRAAGRGETEKRYLADGRLPLLKIIQKAARASVIDGSRHDRVTDLDEAGSLNFNLGIHQQVRPSHRTLSKFLSAPQNSLNKDKNEGCLVGSRLGQRGTAASPLGTTRSGLCKC